MACEESPLEAAHTTFLFPCAQTSSNFASQSYLFSAMPLGECARTRAVGRSARQSVTQSVGRTGRRSVGESVSRLVGRSVGRSVGQSVGQSVNLTVGQSAGPHVCMSSPDTTVVPRRTPKSRPTLFVFSLQILTPGQEFHASCFF